MEPSKLPVPFPVWASTVFLFIFLFLVEVASAEKRAVYRYDADLDVAALLKEVRSPPVQLYATNEKEEMVAKNAWSVQILHRDILMAGNKSYEQRFRERLKRESGRVKALTRRVEIKLSKEKDMIGGEAEIDGFGSDVISGLAEGSGEYFTRIGLGTPPKEQYMVLDTGSDVVWVQCKPCKDCYKQADPVFDPSSSTSFSLVPCGSKLCKQLKESNCDSHGCAYKVAYGDGSFSIGNLAEETLTVGGTVVPKVGIGCGHDNEGLFKGAGGLLGLGAGPLSFPTQLGTEGNPFSYCLVDLGSDSTGSLHFGPETVSSAGSVVTPLLKNPRASTFYYVSLSQIQVGRVTVSLPRKVYRIDEMGRGGVIVDSGTVVTRLQADAYEAMRDTFVEATTHLQPADGVSIFDTCYDLSGEESVKVPVISFNFLNGASLTLPPKNYLFPVTSEGIFCLAFAPTSGRLSIIGSIQQQGIRVSIDSAKSRIGFTPDQC